MRKTTSNMVVVGLNPGLDRSPSPPPTLLNCRHDLTIHNHDRHQTVATTRLAFYIDVCVAGSCLREMHPRDIHRRKKGRVRGTVCRVR